MFYDEDPVEWVTTKQPSRVEEGSYSPDYRESIEVKCCCRVECGYREISKNTRKIEKPPPFGEGLSFCVVVTDCSCLPPV